MSTADDLISKAEKFLLQISKQTDNAVGGYVWSNPLGTSLGFDPVTTRNVVSYLKGQELILGDAKGAVFRHEKGELVALSSEGIKHLSSSSQDKQFVIIVNNIENMINSQMQQLSNNSQQTSQLFTDNVQQFINGLRQILSEEKINDMSLENDLQDLQTEIQSPTNSERIKLRVKLILDRLPLITSSTVIVEKIYQLAALLFGTPS